MSRSPGWTAIVRIERRPPVLDRLAAALAPEAEREVPRAAATLRRDAPGRLDLAIRARDTGALRAALNTYLGWIRLAEETESAVKRSAADR